MFKLTDYRTGEPLTVDRVSRIISKIGKKAGVVVCKEENQFATAHDLRRSFCTRWAKRVMPATLQRLARHSHISTTLTFYVAQNAADIASDLWSKHGETEPVQGNILGNIGKETAKDSGRVNRPKSFG